MSIDFRARVGNTFIVPSVDPEKIKEAREALTGNPSHTLTKRTPLPQPLDRQAAENMGINSYREGHLD